MACWKKVYYLYAKCLVSEACLIEGKPCIRLVKVKARTFKTNSVNASLELKSNEVPFDLVMQPVELKIKKWNPVT